MVLLLPTGDSTHSWKLKDIKWKMVFWFQDYGIILAALTFLGLYFHQSATGYPVKRSAMIYDATISQPHVKSNTVESWQGALIPIVFLLGTLTFTEFLIFSNYNSITNAVTAYLHFTVSALSAWTTGVWVTAFFKNYAGRLRPDYLSRCKPVLPDGRHWDAHLDYNRMVELNCTTTKLEKLHHGSFSFPSQHSTWAMICAWYVVLYISWTTYARLGGLMQSHRYGHTRVASRVAREVLSYLGFMVLAAQVFYVWIIGVNRFRENRHNISDIVAGWFMGLIISTFYALRAIYVYGAVRQSIIDTEERMHETGKLFPDQPTQLTREQIMRCRSLKLPRSQPLGGLGDSPRSSAREPLVHFAGVEDGAS